MGATERDWQALGRAALLALQPDLASAAASRAQDARLLHASACLVQRKAQGLPDGHLHAYALALLVSLLFVLFDSSCMKSSLLLLPGRVCREISRLCPAFRHK